MQYEKRQRGILWGVASAAAALALAVGLMPFTLAFAGDFDDADETPVVTSEPTLGEEDPVATSGPAQDEEGALDGSLQTQESTGTGQGTAKDVYIDNTVDESVSYVVGVIEVTDAVTKEVTTATVYSKSAPVSYSDPKPSAVDKLIVEAIEALWKYADDNGYVYDIDQSMEPVQDNRKVWDNRKYETIEDGPQGANGATTNDGYTRTHNASGGYGKETYFTVTLAVMTGKAAPAATNGPAATDDPSDTAEPAETAEPAGTTSAGNTTTNDATSASGTETRIGLPATDDSMRALPVLLAAMAACGMAMLFAAIRLRPVRPRGKHARW